MNDMENYFSKISEQIERCYEAANRARAKGYDPEAKVAIPLAKTMAERVEGLVSAASPEITGAGVPSRIYELEGQYGKLDWRVALQISLEVAQQKLCKFSTEIRAMETGIRIGIAYLTLGIVSSPLEGFVELKIKKRRDGKDYFCLMYSGPIRSAGGTAGAVSVIVADYVRKNMGFGIYDPEEKEIRRLVTELYDYHERITNLQYLPSEREIVFLAQHLPVQIDGDPSEKIEVSNYKDLDRVETNRIRNGVCLVIGECIAQKASKIWSNIKKWVGEFGLEHWGFLKDFVELQKEIKAKEKEVKAKDKLSPVYTYIQDLVSGRPVLTHPLRAGGFRLRYGKCRTSGYSAASIHPVTMHILNKFIAIGSQLKMERPGKAASITVCDTIDCPVVKLANGDVIRVESESLAKEILPDIQEILFLGDILISYGDFSNRAHPLVPCGYCEEWWALEVEEATVSLFGSIDFLKLSELIHSDHAEIESSVKNCFHSKPSIRTAISLSETLKVPLHPYYTYHWNTISKDQFLLLYEWIKTASLEKIAGEISKIILKTNDEAKRVLELIGVPHRFINREFVVIDGDDASSMAASLGLLNEMKIDISPESDVISLINQVSRVRLRDKSGTFIGARMGRPEKGKIRKLDGDPHTLFPVGEEGGKMRAFSSAIEAGKVSAEFPIYYCSSCKSSTIFRRCEKCDSETMKRFYCKECGIIEDEKCRHGAAAGFMRQDINIKSYFNSALNKLGMQVYPDLIKGVRGTSNKKHIPENFMKGIIRAKHDVYVNKDGTTRYDMTQLPITHFKPKEIGTSVARLREMGYLYDFHGKELSDEEQLLEILPQDIILPMCTDAPELGADKIFLKVACFIDELLEKMYGIEAFHNAKSEQDLAGELFLILAPHTSAGVIGRLIGFSKTQCFYAHPMLHAATRRDCLEYNNYVAIKEGPIWKIEKIGETVENLNPIEEADNFGTLIRKLENIRVYSNPGQAIIFDATKHQPNKMLRIYIEDGRNIELTGNHRVYVKGKKEKRVYDLREGDQIMVSYNRDIEERDIECLFLPEIFSNRDNMMFRNISGYIRKFENISKHENFCFRDSFPIKLIKEILSKHHKSLQDLPPNVKIALKRDKVALPIRINLDDELMEVIGLYIAEGYLRKNSSKKGFYQISIAGNEWIKNFVKKVFYSHFNLKPSHENESQVVFSSRIVYELFKYYLKTGENAKNKRIPGLFLNIRKNKLAALLRGYFEGDGSVSLSDIRVCCDTTSEGLKHDLSFVLSRFGIFTKFYEYHKKPGPQVRNFYIKKNKPISTFGITKIIIPSNFVKKFLQIGFKSERKNKILFEICQKNSYKSHIDFDEHYAYPKITKIEGCGKKISYCFNVASEHNFFANDILVHNCDGDEASASLLTDALINFSREFLPASRGATQDAPLVLTSKIIPTEVDDMLFDVDVSWRYPLEFYKACMEFRPPSKMPIEKFSSRLSSKNHYTDFGFTHEVSNINSGVRCSSYKTLPSMEEKLKGQIKRLKKSLLFLEWLEILSPR